jgi:cytochrome b
MENDMNTYTESVNSADLNIPARVIHLGLVIFGVSAFLTSEFAEDYEHADHVGFTVHSWLGMGLAMFVLLRLVYGLVGPETVRFSRWVPYTKSRLLAAAEDVRTLLRFRLPDRAVHVGLSGLVQTFGLLLFSWMAFTGGLMFFFLEPGGEAGGMLHVIEELHEIGESLIPVFLALHAGAVILHALSGRHIWRNMIFLK